MYNSNLLEKAMADLKSGDTSAFDIIYEQTNRMVYYIIYSILKNREQSEDIMQNVYMKIYEKADMYTPEEGSSAKAWIGTIAKNLALNEYNKNKKETVVDVDDLEYLEDLHPTDTPLIDLASRNLSEDEFTILMLCIVEGYKRREVAAIMNLSTSGVTWKLDQALIKLKKLAEGGKK